ncbi:DUF3908 family protein [Bacillus thuringiensis]|uniref:DUF3908 family protein n=1 Tax=Bacillus thuringiensis TaxID=1428 RepID=UPI002FBF06D5
MEFITPGELYSLASKEKSVHYKKVELLIETLDRSGILVNLEPEYIFYPKKLFREDEDIELLFFSSDTIIVAKIDNFKDVTVQKFLTKDVCKLELQNLNLEDESVELVININDKEVIKLSNKKDTNAAWEIRFFKRIINIFSKLK